MSPVLPIQSVIPEIRSALANAGAAVLIAPPGAGKTTSVAPALIGEDWCSGQIIITSPRRVAARAAAERMAETLGEKPGETVGFMTRLDTRVSGKTRILVMTEAILVNRLVEDPELPGVSAILFDEAHERHLDSDLGLALALETRSVLREDLRAVIMSATIDGARFSRLLGDDAPLIESEGRSFPLETKWLGSNPEQSIEDQVVGGVMTAWRDEDGDILAFLPGVREIERAKERLLARLPDTPVLPLHGQVEPPAQRAAIRRDPEGRRRIVLATAIAETSLTLDGVSVVVDGGLSRHAEFDRAAGTTHLVTHRASQAAATQRAGRAARQSAGVAYRLWEEGGHGGRPEFAPPEIETADLAPLLLKLAKWGAVEPASLAWLDAPPEASVATARKTLRAMGALDESNRITAWGNQISQLPLDPASAAALLFGAREGQGEAVAELIVLMQERGLGGQNEDLLDRRSRWKGERGKRAEAARKLAQRWAVQASKLVAQDNDQVSDPALYLALARPDFVAKKRGASGEDWLSAGGRGFRLDPSSPLARADWIVIADAQGQAKGARITSAAELNPRDVEDALQKQIEKRSIVRWNERENRAEARLEKRLGAIAISSGPDPDPDSTSIVDILVEKALEKLGALLPDGFLQRATFAGIDALSEASLVESADIWLAPLIEGRRDFDLPQHRFSEAALNLLDWNDRQALDSRAPLKFTSPAETRHDIDYAGDDAPNVEVRVQALFGLDSHPMIGNTPLLLKLTSPAGRPIQSTRDLPGFWRGSWSDVAKEMKGRYPKHRWPEQPWAEKPSLKTKNAFNRS
ncbi:ATP-dependent helicase HrpB [Erythrobacter crassostreae]|uniref:ATP-dependent helicase HrpB n=1 Tax=Erythrobacter crassostreae TaxID=2828328 RepID=A0A9X1F4F5_9SPHN|nr:ATP-dependent helicase HrpB [Erythrobacter crassostrea]